MQIQLTGTPRSSAVIPTYALFERAEKDSLQYFNFNMST